jgi:hypothetical protein
MVRRGAGQGGRAGELGTLAAQHGELALELLDTREHGIAPRVHRDRDRYRCLAAARARRAALDAGRGARAVVQLERAAAVGADQVGVAGARGALVLLGPGTR